MRTSAKRAPRCSAMTCASVVSRPWPCEAMPKADFLGVEPEARRRQVHQPLGYEGRGRPPDSAIRAGRHLRGRDRLHAPAVVLDAVRAGQEAHHLHGLERRGPGIDRIGAYVADDIGGERERMAVMVEPQLGIDDLIESLAG